MEHIDANAICASMAQIEQWNGTIRHEAIKHLGVKK